MRKPLTRIGVLFLLVALATWATACATTPIGKAVQSAEAQKKLVEAAMLEVAKLHLKGGIAEPEYQKARAAYQTWARAQTNLATSLAAWKAVDSAENGAKVSTALQQLGPLTTTLLDLVGRFVDLSAIRAKTGG
jgi:predicted small secreted protein